MKNVVWVESYNEVAEQKRTQRMSTKGATFNKETFQFRQGPYARFLCQAMNPDTRAPAMKIPSAGWNTGSQSGNHAPRRAESAVGESCCWATPARNHARMARMKKKSATSSVSTTSFSWLLFSVVAPVAAPFLPFRLPWVCMQTGKRKEHKADSDKKIGEQHDRDLGTSLVGLVPEEQIRHIAHDIKAIAKGANPSDTAVLNKTCKEKEKTKRQ
eukprot:TRINITY_DN579_c0_g2_i2.p1 TRINITY_DN579_c0_g2~~TRINITY_DN579_c0_g2_i2.p1  ORF type:complete len:214 (-),score=8.06 TRINITY_DN579_c0_g2_i2:574-1215(-)